MDDSAATEKSRSLSSELRENRGAVRQRRVLYNLDGDGCFVFKAGGQLNATIDGDDLDKIVLELTQPGSKVTTLLLCLNAQAMYFPTKAGTMRARFSDRWDTRTPKNDDERAMQNWERTREHNLRALEHNNIDPYERIIRAARAAGLEVFLSFRVNDGHRNPALETAFAKENPAMLLDASRKDCFALNFAFPKVTDYIFCLIQEAVCRYDWDGLELDFQRHPEFFTHSFSQAQRNAVMDKLVRRLREFLGNHKKNMVLGIRAPGDTGHSTLPTPEGSLRAGCDVARWAREDWVQFVTLSEFEFSHDQLGIQRWRAEVGDFPIYAALQAYGGGPPAVRLDKDAYLRLAKLRWEEGADGIYLFNFFTSREPPESREPCWEILSTLLELRRAK